MDHIWGRWFLRIGFLAMLVFGSTASLPQVIALADLSTGLMTIVNVIALLLLTKVVVGITQDYHQQKNAGQLPNFKPSANQHKELGLTPGVWQKP
jgi:AGCS family alanine or glycine:cation symporter